MALTAQELVLLAENTGFYCITLAKDGRVVNANKRICQLLGIADLDDNVSIYDYIIDREQTLLATHINQCLQSQTKQAHTFTFATTAPMGISIMKLECIPNGNELFLYGIDITKEYEEHYTFSKFSKAPLTVFWSYNFVTSHFFLSKDCHALLDLEVPSPVSIQTIIDRCSTVAQQKIHTSLQQLNDKTPIDCVEKIYDRQRNVKWIHVLGDPIVHKGHTILVTGSITDITAKHAQLEQLAYNEETKHLALKGIQSGLFDHHFDKNATFYSTDFKKMLGLPIKEDFIGINLLKQHIHPDDLAPGLERHIQGLKQQGSHYFNFYRIKNKLGDYRHYEIHGYRKKDANGRTTRMIGNLIDVHQRKINEQIIEEDKGRLAAMVNNSFAYTILLDRKGMILMADDATLDIIKKDYHVDPILTPTLCIKVIPVNYQTRFAHSFNEALQGKVIKRAMQRVTYKGATQWLEVKYTPIIDQQLQKVNSVLVNCHDITELKTAELAIKEAHLKEQELSNLKSNILSNFSHEIRTPLNGIMTIANLLLAGEEKPLDRQKLKAYLEESKDRLLQTINNLSHYSEIETIQNNLDYVVSDMNYIVETSYREYRHIATSKGLTYTLTLDERCPTANIDENLFHTAINNIIHNAIKYTEKGNVAVSIITIPEKKHIHIKVKDTGIGIHKDNLEKIFDPFVQESFGLSRKYEGTGIGLSLSKKYIEVLGGRISIQSIPEQGSEFTIIIPLSE